MVQYNMITPAFNEELYIERTIKSVICQNLKPTKWIIIDDDSTDNTSEIIKKYSSQNDFIKYYHRKKPENQPYFVSNVYAIMEGYTLIKEDQFDYLAILDSDIILPPNYYSEILSLFQKDQKLGVASGIYENLIHGKLTKVLNDRRSTPKAIQVFRRSVFDQIGGFLPMKYGGEDTCACIIARMNGWKTWSFENIKTIHLRPTGTGNTKNKIRVKFINGLSEHGLGNPLIFVLIKSFKRGFKEKPYILGGFARFIGYCYGILLNEKMIPPKEVIKYNKSEQYQRIRNLNYIPIQSRFITNSVNNTENTFTQQENALINTVLNCFTKQKDFNSAFCLRNKKGKLLLQGHSMRYALILHIGICEWLKYHPNDRDKLPSAWPYISQNIENIKSVEDAALLLWAAVEEGYNNIPPLTEQLRILWKEQSEKCNSLELGWILKSCLVLIDSFPDFHSTAEILITETKNILLNNFNKESKLFQRHTREGFKNKIGRSISCFADQVYPILALSHYFVKFKDEAILEVVKQATDRICRFQGELGQWPWHYDVLNNRICEKYPIFSVHQDSMAPMAIFASDAITGSNHTENINHSIQWLFKKNELNIDMVIEDQGIIWRDLERKELGKFSRIINAILASMNIKNLVNERDKSTYKYKINYEFRPYHYGWLLYTWASK